MSRFRTLARQLADDDLANGESTLTRGDLIVWWERALEKRDRETSGTTPRQGGE